MPEKRLREWVEGYVFNKQHEEYLAASRKEKTMVGMPLQRENLNHNSTTYKDRAFRNNGNLIELAIL